MNKCRETKYLSVGLVIPACHVKQRSLRITRSLVVYAADESLLNKLNKKISFAGIIPDFYFEFSLAHAK